MKHFIAALVLVSMMAGCMWLFVYQLAESLPDYQAISQARYAGVE